MNKYKKSFHIPYYDTDKEGKITPYNILKYFVETSASQTDDFASKEENTDNLNCGWMLYKWKVQINKYPKAKEKVYIETWISNLDRFYAYREFAILNENDEILGVASTIFIFVDMERKRPIRIPNEFIKKSKIINESNFVEFEDFKGKIEIHNYIDFKVRRSDIDYNNHVNNTKYLLWIMEVVPDHIYENYILSQFEIVYKKEIKYGDTILSSYIENEINNNEISFTHKISGKEKSEDHAYGKTKWVKKSKKIC